jgi:hypothetical protein
MKIIQQIMGMQVYVSIWCVLIHGHIDSPPTFRKLGQEEIEISFCDHVLFPHIKTSKNVEIISILERTSQVSFVIYFIAKCMVYISKIPEIVHEMGGQK